MASEDEAFRKLSLAPGATGESTLAAAPSMDQISSFAQHAMRMEDEASSSHDSIPAPAASSSAVNAIFSPPNHEATSLTPRFDFKELDNDAGVVLQVQKLSEETNSVDDGKTSPIPLVPARTGYVYSPLMMLHIHPRDEREEEMYSNHSKHNPHPEKPDRIRYIYRLLNQEGCISRMKRIKIRGATKAEVMLVHDEGIWNGVERTAAFTPETLLAQTDMLEPRHSLYINQQTALCARLSCGGVMEMCEAVACGRVQNGFAIVRPPGHHAEPDQSMGFCLYNNVAVAARFLQEKYGKETGPTRCKRILIVDWDVHHGNGVQSAFIDNPDVLYISIHRYDAGTFYPGGTEGDYDKVGKGEGRGFNVNIPWPKGGMGDGEYMSAFFHVVMPIAKEFDPDLVIISAGFDAAKGDDLGECEVTPSGYAHMTYLLASLARGKLVVALEGGYNLDAIATSSLAVTNVLLGSPPQDLEGSTTCMYEAAQVLGEVEMEHSKYWKCMRKPHHVANPGEDEGLEVTKLSAALAVHRGHMMSQKYNLLTMPMPDVDGDNTQRADGSCLCSPDIFRFDDARRPSVVLLFVHDMGNLRLNTPDSRPSVQGQAELASIVDGSGRVVEWSRQKHWSLIDLSLLASEAPTRKDQKSEQGRTVKRMPNIGEALRRQRARMMVEHVWDNVLLLALGPEQDTNVVLFGFGTACEAVMHLVENRRMDNVKAVVQLPCYGPAPATGRDGRRKWYHKNSRVFLPRDHKLFLDENDQASTAKRYGKIVRSKEPHALQVLRSEFSNIVTFVDKMLSSVTPVVVSGPIPGISTPPRPPLHTYESAPPSLPPQPAPPSRAVNGKDTHVEAIDLDSMDD